MHTKIENDQTGCQLCQKYYPLSTLASMFEVSEKTLRRMIADRRIKAKRIAGCVRIPHSELNKIVREY